MAVPYFHFVPAVMIQKSVSTKRHSSIVVMCAGNNISINRKPSQIRFPPLTRNKVVFEDEATGIVCYRDENGEITCEGYDEGPRFHRQLSSFVSCQSDADIIDFLCGRIWFQSARDAKF